MNNQGSTTYRHPGNVRVRLALFWVSNYFGTSYDPLLKQTEALLNAHSLALDCWPSRLKTDQTALAFNTHPLVEREDYEGLRRAAADVLSAAGKTNYLPVLFCQFRYPANGLTVADTAVRCWQKPMCLISPTVNKDNATLLHEVGHAAGLDHDRTSVGTQGRNFMNETETRSTMMQWQILKMTQAFYAKP